MALNPLFWVQLRLGNNWRNLILVPTALAVLVLGFASASYYWTDRGSYGAVSATWLAITTAAQAAFLLLIAPSAIRRAVLTDFQSGMIESHRLSPMGNLKIVTGYLSGPPVQAVVLYAVSLVLGTYFAGHYAQSFGLPGTMGVAVGGWYFFQLCLLFAAFLVAALVLLTALATAGKTNVIGAIVLVGILGGWVAVRFVPGLALLSGALSGSALLETIRSGQLSGDPAVILLALLVQLALATTLVRAACRLVRTPGRSLFSIPLSLVLLGIWTFASIAGIAHVPQNQWLFGQSENTARVQLICSTAAFLLVAQFALTAAVAERFHLDRAAALGAAVPSRRRRQLALIPPLLALATVLTLLLMYNWVEPGRRTELDGAFGNGLAIAAILAALFFSYWFDYGVAYFAAATGQRVLLVLLGSVIAFKALPIAVDEAIRYFVRELAGQSWVGYGGLTGISPIGTLILCHSGGVALWAGLLVQALLAGAATHLARRARRRLAANATTSSVSLATQTEKEVKRRVLSDR
jgi:hypothetical protein